MAKRLAIEIVGPDVVRVAEGLDDVVAAVDRGQPERDLVDGEVRMRFAWSDEEDDDRP